MRRLEEGRDALSLLEAGALRPEDLDTTADRLARFHDGVGLGTPAPWEPEAWWQHVFRPFADTLASLAQTGVAGVSGAELEALAAAARARFEALRPLLERRRVEGRAVDGHGDVHLQHVWLERGAPAPVLIDCVEFDADLRRIDAANEVAFLAMDLAYRGRRDLAERFLRSYAAARDDFGLYDVVDAFQSYRAAVRAKVAALAAVDRGIGPEQRAAAAESARRHFALADATLAARADGGLVLVCGSVGVGKSTVAAALADRVHGVVLSSDRTRKHLAGIPALEHRGDAPDRGLYEPARVDAVYDALLERAGPVVGSGRAAVLDATFARSDQRERARRWASEHGLRAQLLEVRCDDDVARARIARRKRAGLDPSDAGPELVAISRARFEPLDEWPTRDRAVVRTDRDSRPDAQGDALEDVLEAVASRLATT
jgi:predicted kinase